MYIRIFISPLLFIMLLFGQIVILPSQVFATCCGCGYCWMKKWTGCTCNDGSDPTHCAWCPNPYAPTNNSVLDVRAARESLPSSNMKSDLTEQLIVFTLGENRVLANFSLRLLEKVDSLELGCQGGERKNIGNTLQQFVRSYTHGELG